MKELDPIQQAARSQFERQSARYGSGHILADVSDVARLLELSRQSSHATGTRRRALDVATGGGHTAMLLASTGWAVTAGDLSAAMLHQTVSDARGRHLNLLATQHAAESLPYATGAFAIVSCRVAPHHFSDPAAFVGEVARVLEPGGTFLLIDGSIADGHPEAEHWLHEVEKLRDPSHHRFLSMGEWRHLCAAAGLSVTHAALTPMKQPDLEWYFETAGTPASNRKAVRRLVEHAPTEARELFHVSTEDGKVVWWWQRLELLATRSPHGSGLATIGYEGLSLDEYLGKLRDAGITVLCDVRRNPVSRKFGFSKKRLADGCDAVGIRYEHLPQLGIASDKRHHINTDAARDALFHWYEHDVLPHERDALRTIRNWIEAGERVALTCFERDASDCHRQFVARALEQLMPSVSARHL